MTVARLTLEAAERLAWEHLRASGLAKRAVRSGFGAQIVMKEQWASIGFGWNTGWVISYDRKLPRGFRADDCGIGVFVDDATDECTFV